MFEIVVFVLVFLYLYSLTPEYRTSAQETKRRLEEAIEESRGTLERVIAESDHVLDEAINDCLLPPDAR